MRHIITSRRAAIYLEVVDWPVSFVDVLVTRQCNVNTCNKDDDNRLACQV